MNYTREELGTINIIIDSTFDTTTCQFKPRGVPLGDRVNSFEIYKKIHNNVEKEVFVDGEVEFNPQEKEFLRKLLNETLPADITRIAIPLLTKLS